MFNVSDLLHCATTLHRYLIFLVTFLALSLEQDIPDYDMDSGDEMWLDSQEPKLDLTPYQFEQMIDRLEKITVCSLDDAKALVRRNEVNPEVFDYWVNKRLNTVSCINISSFHNVTRVHIKLMGSYVSFVEKSTHLFGQNGK